MDLLNKKIVIITGKGGVGKSLISLALAAYASKKGKKVLLAELGERSYFEHVTTGPVGFEPSAPFVEWPNLSLARWTGQKCLKEYVQHILKVSSLVSLFLEHPVMKAFINAAPALSDVSILGKLTSGERDVRPQLNYDLVILDAFSTGHFLSMIRAPKGLAEAIRVGPMGSQSREIHKVLTDSEVCGFGVVTLPEELPVQEAKELVGTLKEEWSVLPDIFCNQVYPSPPNLDAATDDAFVESLKLRLAKQESALKQIRTFQQDRLTVVPMVFEQSPLEVARALVESFEANEYK